MIDRYDWSGGSEALWHFGPDTGPVVALALPPFEEANRTRTFAVGMLRALAARGVASILPDLPGQGESPMATDAVSLSAWREAFAAACRSTARPIVAASIRAGALLDQDADAVGRWQLAPQSGTRLVRELRRIGGSEGRRREQDPVVEIGGNRVASSLLDVLATAVPFSDHPIRIVRLGDDPAAADLRIDAAPLWRRAEPDDDPRLATLLADDLAAWAHACAGC